MVEFPHILKVTELLRGKLGSIVTDDFVWNSMPSEVLFQLVDHSCWWSGLQSVYFKEIANLVYSDEVLVIADWKQVKVYSYDRPRTVGCLMRNESFFLLWRFISSTSVTLRDKILDFWVHAWPIHTFSDSAKASFCSNVWLVKLPHDFCT